MAPRTGYFHFISIWTTSLAPSTSWLPFSAVVCCSAVHNSFPLWRKSLRGLYCGLVMIFNYTDACTQGVKEEGGGLLRIKGLDLKWTSMSLQMHLLKMVNSAPGYRKAISWLRAVHVSNRGAWKPDIRWTHGLQDSYNKNINFALFWAFIFPFILSLDLIFWGFTAANQHFNLLNWRTICNVKWQK